MGYLADLIDKKKAVDQQVLKEVSLGRLIALVPILVEAIRKRLFNRRKCQYSKVSIVDPRS